MLLIIISFIGGAGVILGAIAKHVLQGVLSVSEFEIFKTAVSYHQLYSVLLLSLELARENSRFNMIITKSVMTIFLLGVGLFSGSLYAYIALNLKFLMMITPIGGFLLIVGWGLLILNSIKREILI